VALEVRDEPCDYSGIEVHPARGRSETSFLGNLAEHT
jgi:hypothetical protein